LYAIKTIEEVHKAGGKITSFLSYCGGLPTPEASVNPLGYKFSWSSRGVLLALRNAAKYYQGGKVVDIAGKDLMVRPRHTSFTLDMHLLHTQTEIQPPTRSNTTFQKKLSSEAP
jgi:saccharopine dehydrogenase-like NADP-dependent oxidoreductase